jgi:hypothetical protein
VFQNSWVSIPDDGTPAYCLDGAGYVHLEGVVTNGTADSVVFTLPPGFRPGFEIRIPTNSGLTETTDTIQVKPNGDVLVRGPGVGFVHLDSVEFRQVG